MVQEIKKQLFENYFQDLIGKTWRNELKLDGNQIKNELIETIKKSRQKKLNLIFSGKFR